LLVVLLNDVLPKFIIFLAISQFHWPITRGKKKKKTLEASQFSCYLMELGASKAYWSAQR
jgi:hypothetical protein